MKIKCPCCGDCFTPNEDHLRWPSSEDISLYDSSKFTWEKIPLLRSMWNYSDNGDNQTLKQTDKKIVGEEQ